MREYKIVDAPRLLRREYWQILKLQQESLQDAKTLYETEITSTVCVESGGRWHLTTSAMPRDWISRRVTTPTANTFERLSDPLVLLTRNSTHFLMSSTRVRSKTGCLTCKNRCVWSITPIWILRSLRALGGRNAMKNIPSATDVFVPVSSALDTPTLIFRKRNLFGPGQRPPPTPRLDPR